ncbi:hypothetical protein D3C84_746170 [compost metagenome]
MRGADVVGVAAEVFRAALPVRLDDEALGLLDDLHAVRMQAEDGVEHPGGGAEVLAQRRHFIGQGGEDEAVQHFHARSAQQAPFLLVERAAVGILQVRGAGPVAVVAIGPAMVGALEGAGVALVVVADFGATVAAVVEHDIDLATVVAGDDDLVETQATEHEVALVGDFGSMGNEDPGSRKDSLHLGTEHRVVTEHFDRQQAFVQAFLNAVAEIIKEAATVTGINKIVVKHACALLIFIIGTLMLQSNFAKPL